MFGFRFLENFNFPYISQSIREFWQRWHISLSNWFRDYLYIPLGGNRCGDARVSLNLLIVFFLCGLWHGASWSFIVWGLYHGTFLGLERSGLGTWLKALPRFFRHVYVLLVVMIGWVFFRADTLTHGMSFLGTMFGFVHGWGGYYTVPIILNRQVALVLALGIIGSTPIIKNILLNPDPERWRRWQYRNWSPRLMATARVAFIALVMSLSIMEMASGTYNPFIYFRF
jgi:alginate O-acetyltransferase complex protein AlgI